MAKRRRPRKTTKAPTERYTDPDGNVLTLRCTLSSKSIRTISAGPAKAATTLDDADARREEMLFERLVQGWEIAGLPLDGQQMLLGRFRMADAETRRWVLRTIDLHIERYLPELHG